jgi:hypothetical protein
LSKKFCGWYSCGFPAFALGIIESFGEAGSAYALGIIESFGEAGSAYALGIIESFGEASSVRSWDHSRASVQEARFVQAPSARSASLHVGP